MVNDPSITKQELRSFVEMLAACRRRTPREFRQVNLDTFSLGREGQALEEVGRSGHVGALGKTHPLLGANHGKQLPPVLVLEEVFEADIENHSDPRQRGKRGNHLSVFQLGKHGGRQSRVLPQVYQGDLLTQAQLPELPAKLVGGQNPLDRLRTAFPLHLNGV